MLETLAIFRAVNSIGRSTHNRHTGRFQGTGQFQGRLTTELDNHPFGLFDTHDFQNIFQGHRLEEQTIGSVVIRRHGLRVTVDHNGFVAIIAHSQCRVNTAVVEFNTLADTVWSATQNQDLVLVTGARFTLFLVGRVHIGCIC